MPTAEPHNASADAGERSSTGGRSSTVSETGPARARAKQALLRRRARARAASRPNTRHLAWFALALILLAALGLRLWGIRQGLPYVYNIDEAGHFVPKAVAMFSNGLNPRYFVNPPALTYVLHLLFAVWFGGARGVASAYAAHPADVFLLARVTVALFGAGAVWLLYAVGARLFDRRVALLAAALEAVAFLPVFYGHFALNDAFTLAPLTLSLLGSAGVLRKGRRRDYVLAGVGLGLGCASKYTAGIALVPLLAAIAARYLDSPAGGGRRALEGLALAAGCALAAFLIANPYALLDFKRFHSELIHQSSLAEEAQGKLGAPKESGIVYYLWSLTWGLGWAPALAALGGALGIWRRDARVGWMLVPAAVLFLAFMGLQGRYFGRWLLPIFPIVCLLAAHFALTLATALTTWLSARERDRRRPGRRGRVAAALAMSVGPALAAVALLAQGAVFSVHNDLVLARADTRNLTRSWMVEHVPRGSQIVLEPVVLSAWLTDGGRASKAARWVKYPALESVIAPGGRFAPQSAHTVALEDYETTLSPALIGWYERWGYCWVVTGSTESGRAFADPRAAPRAVAYYRALAKQALLVYHASPYSQGSDSTRFSFDWTFDYYPLAYRRPGPAMSVYRLRGGACAAGPSVVSQNFAAASRRLNASGPTHPAQVRPVPLAVRAAPATPSRLARLHPKF